MDIRRLVKSNIVSLRAYAAKEIPCNVKLDANESPYGFPGFTKAIKTISTNRYPDPEARELKNLIALQFRVKPENILQGNGSDELIYYLIATFGGPVLYPVPTFTMYGIIAQALGEKKVEVALDREFDLDIRHIIPAIRQQNPKILFLSSPNNPTGNCYSTEHILKIIEAVEDKAVVVIDEAYQPFASRKGFMPMLKDYENLIIMRTLSKIGLAGLRIGFLIADRKVIDEVNKVRLPFNVNSLSQAIAVSAIKNTGFLKQRIQSIVSERKKLVYELSNIRGVHPYPSEANFILFRIPNTDTVYKSLLQHGVLVRNMNGVIDGCLRVTVGTPKENKVFLKALRLSV